MDSESSTRFLVYSVGSFCFLPCGIMIPFIKIRLRRKEGVIESCCDMLAWYNDSIQHKYKEPL